MLGRSRASLGSIVQGLLTVGLCTLAAVAQQPSAPATSAGTVAPVQASAATPQDAAQPTPDSTTDQTPAAQPPSSDANNTGISNPEAVTSDPAPNSASPTASDDQNTTQPAASATPAAPSSDANPVPQAPDSSATPAAASADPSPADPNPTVKSNDFPASIPAEAAASATQNEQRFAPDQPPAPLTPDHDSNTPAQPDPPAQSTPAAGATNAASQPAAQAAPSIPSDTNSSAPQSTAPVPDATAPQQSAPATPGNAAPAAPIPATSGSPATPAAAPDTSAPQSSASQSSAPTTPPAPDATAPQQSAPATPDNTTPPATSSDSPAPTASQTTAPATPAASDSAPPAATTAPAPDAAAPSASQDQAPAAPQPPAPVDNQAVNPSMPGPQVNEALPPAGSRFDIFGGYTYLRPSGTVGTWNFPDNNTRGYIASGTWFFKHQLGVQAEFSHSEYLLGTTGPSPAPPFVQLGGLADSFYTFQAGPVYRFFLGEHVIPFVHFTAGGAKVAGPKFQPLTWGYGFSGGAGVDVLLSHTHKHVAFRLAQVDFGYMHADQGVLQQFDLAGGTQAVSNLRISTGLVFRFGEKNPVQSKSLACDATPSEVYAGERVTLAATLRNYRDKTKTPFFFRWELSAGKQQGFGPVIFADTTGLGEGTYHATAHISIKEKGKQFAQCSTTFVVKASPVPTLKCSADPSTVSPGQVSTITAYASSIAQRQLTYSYTTTEGQIGGTNSTAELHTDGLPPGVATVTCRVLDDLGQTAVATTEVTIAPPSLPPAPKAQPLCTVYFNRDMRRPARVDNEGRACLDDIALTLEHQPDARLVLVGEHSDSEVDGQLTAAERAMNTRAYLANEKGIDPSRVDVRTSTTPGRQVQTFLLAPGAIFDQPTEGQIDESKIKIHGQQYARQRMHPPQKGPVGHGVSHPPKN